MSSHNCCPYSFHTYLVFKGIALVAFRIAIMAIAISILAAPLTNWFGFSVLIWWWNLMLFRKFQPSSVQANGCYCSYGNCRRWTLHYLSKVWNGACVEMALRFRWTHRGCVTWSSLVKQCLHAFLWENQKITWSLIVICDLRRYRVVIREHVLCLLWIPNFKVIYWPD